MRGRGFFRFRNSRHERRHFGVDNGGVTHQTVPQVVHSNEFPDLPVAFLILIRGMRIGHIELLAQVIEAELIVQFDQGIGRVDGDRLPDMVKAVHQTLPHFLWGMQLEFVQRKIPDLFGCVGKRPIGNGLYRLFVLFQTQQFDHPRSNERWLSLQNLHDGGCILNQVGRQHCRLTLD